MTLFAGWARLRLVGEEGAVHWMKTREGVIKGVLTPVPGRTSSLGFPII